MKYKFPTIRTINDVLTSIKEHDEFIVAQRDGYTIINYVVQKSTTFDGDDEHALIRRECRGLIFNRDGILISRPLHKFFNINEKSETQSNLIDLSIDHNILDKLDGSMIRPISQDWISGSWNLATKMGITDISKSCEKWLRGNHFKSYDNFIKTCVSLGYTPIFEWVSPNNRIVIKYNEPKLILIAIRHTFTGEYLSYEDMGKYCDLNNIPIVNNLGRGYEIDYLIKTTREIKGIEGYVLRFNDGHAVKIKCDEYVLMHRTKEIVQKPRHVVKAIIDNVIDDYKSISTDEDRITIYNIEEEYYKFLTELANFYSESFNVIRENYSDKATYAKNSSGNRSHMFSMWNGKSAKECAIIEISKYLNQDKMWDDFILKYSDEYNLKYMKGA